MPKVYPDIEQCILAYLREHEGSAPAGEVTAHAIDAGFSSATVRRVADRVVTKRREGNSFTWSIRPKPTFSALPEEPPRTNLASSIGRGAVLVDRSRKLTIWDAQKYNGERYDPRQHQAPIVATPPVARRDPSTVAAPEPTEHADSIDSPYARMRQAERLDLIATRPTLTPWTDGFPTLTEVEAVALLDADDAREIPLPELPHGTQQPSTQNLPY